ncbi:MAG: ABC transporter permease [Anaerolineae bacterium]|nr:ABC transporter permease [Anaerolineae bacterium]
MKALVALVSLFRAEWTKMVEHRWVTAFMIWIFPVGALAFVIVMSLLLALFPVMREAESTQNLGVDQAEWTEQAISVWGFANSLLGRMVMLAFTSVVFAGEYRWQTWKNLVPRRRRRTLIVMKFVAVGTFIVVAFTLMSLIMAVGWGVMVAVAGGSYGPAITGDVLVDFAGDYAREAWLAFTLTVIAASFAALAGMFTRSILGGVLVSIVITYAEGLSILVLALLAHVLDTSRLIYLYRLTPSYNVANVTSWIRHNRPETAEGTLTIFGDLIDFADDVNFSVAILVVWVVALVALTVYLFENQDIT